LVGTKGIDAVLPARRDELRQATEAVERCRAEIGQLEAIVGSLRLLKEWQDANPEAPARIQQMMVDLERLKSELAAVQQKLAQDEHRYNEVRQETDRLTQESASLREQFAALQKQKSELEKVSRDLDDQRRTLEPLVASLKAELQSTEARLSTLNQQADEAEKEKLAAIRERDHAIADRDVARSEKLELDARLAALRDQLTSVQKELADVEKVLRGLDDQRRQLEGKLSGARSELQTIEARLATSQQQLKQADLERAAITRERDQARAACDAAKAELAGHQKSIEQLKDLAKGMQVNLERAGVTGHGNYADLFAPLAFPSLMAAGRDISEQQAVQRAREYLRGQRLIFHDRVVYAFHTALKVSDISPLVVLAGISGTGKSELPRHYADGMGMHFLLMAVQPRWDSPQDLFGFYNYLERRYKATELARVFVQFERFKRQKLRDWNPPPDAKVMEHDRSDRLLLVLLDEMNLARTEYYFSDFLSKLETRRMVNENNPEDRARAEVELDMGSMLEGQKSIRLYPSRNIFFVGTMNEDESTQSLSDKVVDRASVLRFGRPKRTNPEIIGGTQARPERGITLESWSGWIRGSDDLGNHTDEVDGWIDRLNDSLDELGRPFAYRVDRAIRSYVANYPRWVDDWHKKAMADQIEQRIFPKLRGIEPEQAQSALREIGKVIDQLDDLSLKQAFRKSWEGQPSFVFRGVGREENG